MSLHAPIRSKIKIKIKIRIKIKKENTNPGSRFDREADLVGTFAAGGLG